MRNENAKSEIDNCKADLAKIEREIARAGSTSPMAGFLTKYAAIRISGSLEVAYKTIIADHYETPAMAQFLENHVRSASSNATYDNICRTLKDFDEEKSQLFKTKVKTHKMNSDKLTSSFSAINRARNDIAHGKNNTISFVDLRAHYDNAIEILETLDSVM